MLEQVVSSTASDADLGERVRSGDTRAFAELWQRHYRPAYRAAQQFSRTIDPDDLISEAYLRVYQQLLLGKGPTAAFRPYLYAIIRNVALSWRSTPSDATEPLPEELEDQRLSADPMIRALDRSLTSKAFHSLPERWQTVLWYTEIEGMDPHEVAPVLGLSPNGVAALAHRAREGLREAWLQAHVSDDGISAECQWAMKQMGGHARDNLGARDRAKLDLHLADCARCILVTAEIEEVGSRLALVMIPLILGGTAGASFLEQLSHPSMSILADAVVPSMPLAGDVAHSDATMLPMLGMLPLAVIVGSRARLIAVVGAVILIGSLAIGVTRVLDAPAEPSPVPSITMVH